MKARVLLVVLSLCLGIASAQQFTNTNDSVIKMVKAGMSDSIVISTINSQPAQFSLSANDLIALKQAGVSDAVMAAMIAKNAPAAAPASSTKGPDQSYAPATYPNPPESVPPPPPPFHSTDGKVRLYVTDDPMFESNGVFRAGGNQNGALAAGASHTQAGDDPRTVEIEADILKVCPAYVLASNNPDRADLVLVFRRRGGARTSMFAFGGLTGLALSAGQKVDGASLFQPDGDMLYATKKNTVEKAIRDVCAHISPKNNLSARGL